NLRTSKTCAYCWHLTRQWASNSANVRRVHRTREEPGAINARADVVAGARLKVLAAHLPGWIGNHSTSATELTCAWRGLPRCGAHCPCRSHVPQYRALTSSARSILPDEEPA